MKSKHLLFYAVVTLLVLAVPLVAMQFTDEVDWKLPDFVIIGTLLFGTGLVYELVAMKIKNTKQRAMIALALLFVMLLIWAELAVGLFGTPFGGS